jgi:hypothetical protein
LRTGATSFGKLIADSCDGRREGHAQPEPPIAVGEKNTRYFIAEVSNCEQTAFFRLDILISITVVP